MAIALATCTCRHCGKEFVIRTNRRNTHEAAEFEAWAARNIDICDDCANADLAARNADAGLPALTGSPKQIAWAESIRADRLDKVRQSLDKAMDSVVRVLSGYDGASIIADHKALYAEVTAHIAAKADARWWIDHRQTDGCNLFREAVREMGLVDKAQALADATAAVQS